MCGIAGWLGPSRPQHETTARGDDCLRRLQHRGPDAQSTWTEADSQQSVWLGHVRLAVIDPSAAATQPMGSPDGRFQLVFNGEIYNHHLLRRELEALGYVFRTRSDTEVLLHGFAAWGEGVVERMRGMFAFAVWDRFDKVLFAARDRLGIKPLYYGRAGEGDDESVVFGSEIHPLFALAPLSGDIDLGALDDYLTYLYVPPPATFWRAVRELPPAHTLRIRRTEGGWDLRIRRYWTLPRGVQRIGLEEAMEQVRAELQTVVSQHAVADVPVGAFLSGGVDSTVLVGLLARQSSRPLRTFCMTFGPEEHRWDEREFARLVAQRFGTEHTEVPVRPDVAALLPTLVTHFGQPFGNPTALLVAELARQTREHVTVALAGDGGDEIFLGYPRYLGMEWKARYGRVPGPVRDLLAGFAERWMVDSLRGRHLLRRAREFVTTGAVPPDEAYTSWVSYFEPPDRGRLLHPDVQRKLAGRRAEDFLLQLLSDTTHLAPASRAARADVSSFLPGNVLAYGDRMSMLHALEVRVPFCDHVLVELLASMPASLNLRGGTTKALLKAACADVLPLEVKQRGKQGFNPPMAMWLRDALRPHVDRLVHEPSEELRSLVQPAAIRQLADEHASGRRDRSLHLWSLIVLETWLQERKGWQI